MYCPRAKPCGVSQMSCRPLLKLLRGTLYSTARRHSKDKKQVFYLCSLLVRVRRIELRSNAWEAFVLPLNYTRVPGSIAHYKYFFPYARMAAATFSNAAPFLVSR